MKFPETIEIAKKKNTIWKNIFLVINFLALIYASLFILIYEKSENTPKTPLDIIAGSLGLLLFGIIPLLLLWFKKDTKILLTISNKGFENHESGQYIAWEEIKAIRLTSSLLFSKYIAIELNDQTKFMDSPNKLKRMVERLSYRLTGAQIFISTVNMDIKLEKLYALLQEKIVHLTVQNQNNN